MKLSILLFALALGAPATATADWSADVAEQVEAARAAAPDLFEAVMVAQPALTRAGTLRFFGDSAVLDPAAVPAVVHRLATGDDDDDVRRALAERLHRVDAAWDAARLSLLTADPSPKVRAMLAAGLRWTSPDVAAAGLEAALADRSSRVRAEAASTLGRRADGVELLPLLLPALEDPAADVRLQALRSTAALAPEVAVARVPALLTDADPRVVRAASRLVE